MLNIKKGNPIAYIDGGKLDDEVIYVDENNENGVNEIKIRDGCIKTMMNMEERGIYYIAGPSGSGKTSYALDLIDDYLKIYPKTEFYLFSRTDYKNDPAFKRFKKVYQIDINEDLLDDPIDIETELSKRSILLFDDCNTIQNNELKRYIEDLMIDVMEVGRKLNINIVITNHLVVPNERKFARILLNEFQYLTIFPKSGSSQQISHVLKSYFGLNKDQIARILELPSRWVTIIKKYPLTCIYDKGVFIL